MEKQKKKRKLKAPNSYVIIMAIILLVAILSWVLPGGAYNYVDPDADTLEPIAGTYHEIASNPQGLWDVIMAPINGFMDSVDIILYCLIIGGYIAIVMRTGAFDAAIGHAMKKLKGREHILIPILMLIFSLAGAMFGIEEETLPFFLVLIPVFLVAGYDTLVGPVGNKSRGCLGRNGFHSKSFRGSHCQQFCRYTYERRHWDQDNIAVYIHSCGYNLHYALCQEGHAALDCSKSLVYAQRENRIKNSSSKAGILIPKTCLSLQARESSYW